MLIRFVVENVLSFDERKEFQMIPQKTLRTLKHHVYEIEGQNLLKMSSIYGANGSGKSNLIKSLSLLQDLVLNKINGDEIQNSIFKFNSSKDMKQILAVEFFQNEVPFYYGIEIRKGIVATEELYISGLGKTEDKLVFKRETNEDLKTSLKFTDQFESQERNQMFKDLLISEFIKPKSTILKFLGERDNEMLLDTKATLRWFINSLLIVFPKTKFSLASFFVQNDKRAISELNKFMTNINIGIKSFSTEKTELMKYLGKNDEDLGEKIKMDIKKSNKNYITTDELNKDRIEVAVSKEGSEYYVIKPVFTHLGKNGKEIDFDFSEESDGTVRMIDLLPVFKLVSQHELTVFIDEIENSLHPNLIKEIVKTFSNEESTNGQLIFTTHESNLLDQGVFRQDEIWFTEKDKNGSTDIYSLSDFKEHKTKDIEKGYLCGRYGSIPFLSNLKDLGWLKNDNK